MKVLLIQPWAANMVASIVPSYVVEGAGHYPPLGLLYVAAALRRADPAAEVIILDAALERLDPGGVRERVRREGPDIVGITATTFTLIDAAAAAAAAKEGAPGSHVCVGGPHTSVYPEETLLLPGVDSIVIGEGEESFPELAARVSAGKSLEGLAGVWAREKGGVVRNPRREFIPDLDALAFPARDLTNHQSYRSVIGAKALFTTMISSRGCPFNCLYCYQAFGRRFRARSAAGLLEEIRTCRDLGIEEFWFFDDSFTADRARALEFCDALIAGRFGISWDMRTRADLLDPELLDRLKESGCRRIFIGVESGVDRTLKTLRKQIDLAKARSTVAEVRRRGFEIYLDFMIGSPGETREEILRTIEFAKELDPDYLQFAVTTPYPDTDLYHLGLANGTFKTDFWREFARKPDPAFKPQLLNEHLSRAELLELLDLAYKRFYLRPRYILRRLSDLKSPSDLFHKAAAALRLFASTLYASAGPRAGKGGK